MNEQLLCQYWDEIPIGKENAYTYTQLCLIWGFEERRVRRILHDLSRFDNGDNYILIRSCNGKGFYKTDNAADIAAYRAECLNKGKSIFAPLRKIDRVLKPDTGQLNMVNNLKEMRLARGLKQSEVCRKLKEYGIELDTITLSKMENSHCAPTPWQLAHLASVYGCSAVELVDMEIYTAHG